MSVNFGVYSGNNRNRIGVGFGVNPGGVYNHNDGFVDGVTKSDEPYDLASVVVFGVCTVVGFGLFALGIGLDITPLAIIGASVLLVGCVVSMVLKAIGKYKRNNEMTDYYRGCNEKYFNIMEKNNNKSLDNQQNYQNNTQCNNIPNNQQNNQNNKQYCNIPNNQQNYQNNIKPVSTSVKDDLKSVDKTNDVSLISEDN